MFFSNQAEDQFLQILQASIIETDGLQTTIILSERERVNAIAKSESVVKGGDGSVILFDVHASGVQDVAFNGNSKQTSVVVYETPDSIVPNITNGTLDYSHGVLTLQATEIVDTTPASMIVLPLILIVNNTGDALLALTGATVLESDQYQVTIQLTEYQRARSVERSSTPGGDNVPVVVDLRDGAVNDIALNNITDIFAVEIVEVADTKRPTAIQGHINYENGILKLTADESIDSNATFAVFDRTKFFIRDVTGTGGFDLADTIIVGNQRPEIYFFLSELQRVEGIKISGTPGGDFGAAILDTLALSFNDLSGNPSLEALNITMTESADAKSPQILTTDINFNNGTMVLTASETLRVANAYNGFKLINTTHIVFKNVSNGAEIISLDAATVVSHAESNTITLVLEEADRVALIPFSQGPGGDYDPALYGEPATFGGDGGALLAQFKTGSFFDMAINPNALSNELVVTSVEDLIRPQILSAEINYGVGLVRIFCTETIDVTPPTLVNLTQIFIVDETGDRSLPNAIALTGASINITDDSPIVTIKMTETQRVNSIMISGVPGGDGTAAKFDAFAPCIKDIAGNHNPVDLLLNLSIFELPDLIDPTITRVTIDYNIGMVTIFVSEQVPDSGVFIGNMTISDNEHGNISGIVFKGDRRYGNAVQYMQGAIDLTKKNFDFINITLTEVQRVGAIKLSNTPGGDGTAAFLHIFPGGVQDRSRNPNKLFPVPSEISAEFVTMEEIQDSTRPAISVAILNLGNGDFTLI
jgi:hypothetical protein